ncbi:helix-turn-helix transcriptional regulator [Hamadaea sp. NPDC051192]|uniref:helix-turn-helix transcriptional regulator n=1 Tax=Hamadaea sp. NPDC051192 TaxID=3154940 RepID=UPI003429F81A
MSRLTPSPFGRLIHDGIGQLGVTREQFAELVGVARTTVQTWLSAERPQPREDQRQAVADALDVSRILVDEAVLLGMGYRLTAVPKRTQYLARLAARLSDEDLAEFERLLLSCMARYRKGKERPDDDPDRSSDS